MQTEQTQGATQEAQTQATTGGETQNGDSKTQIPERLSPQFAALARKEKAIRLEAQKIKAEREALQKERDQFKSPGYITKEELRTKPIQILTENGWSYDQIAEMLLNQSQGIQSQQTNQGPTIQQLLQRIEELEGKTTKVETQFNEKETKDREQAINQIRNEAKILIDSDPAYETIKASNKLEAVVEHIKQTYDEDGILLSVEEAAKEVEDALVEETLMRASLGKIKERLQPKAEEVATPPPAPQQQRITVNQQQQPLKTLTHEMTVNASKQSLSAKDRVKRAVMRAQGLDPDTGKPIAG